MKRATPQPMDPENLVTLPGPLRYSPASRYHQLHLDPVGYQDSQHLLVGSLLHTAFGRREGEVRDPGLLQHQLCSHGTAHGGTARAGPFIYFSLSLLTLWACVVVLWPF